MLQLTSKNHRRKQNWTLKLSEIENPRKNKRKLVVKKAMLFSEKRVEDKEEEYFELIIKTLL